MIKHTTVFAEPGVFAGWPANHGAWQWGGGEFLVGFMTGPYTRKMRSHQIGEPFTKLQARSLDGGDSWTVETPNVDFEARETGPAPAFDTASTIIRGCGVYDHGGDECSPAGGFYLSDDRGRHWSGAFAFDGLEALFDAAHECTARTSIIGNLAFLARRQAGEFGTDVAFVAERDGERFRFKSTICDDGDRAAMPSAARIGDRLVVALRRRGAMRAHHNWIEAFGSDDGGASWRSLSQVVVTSSKNGNPPALIAAGDKLVCAYGDRDQGAMVVSISSDAGLTWPRVETLRTHGKSDIGYPQLFLRPDGDLVCVYYWAAPKEEQRIEATRFRI